MSKGQLAIAGTGRLAGALAHLLPQRGWEVVAVCGRERISELPQAARRILIAVSDGAIAGVAEQLRVNGLSGGVVLHTSGAAGPDALAVLRQRGSAIGVLHPLQTIPTAEAGAAALPGSAFALAGDPEAIAWARELVASLNGTALAIESSAWTLYHAAAVVASNYQVTLTDAALELMERAGIPRAAALRALAPLILSAASNTIALGPESALTGPVRRADVETVGRHLLALQSAPLLLQLYTTLGARCVDLARRAGLPAEEARRLIDVFRTEGACTETPETDS